MVELLRKEIKQYFSGFQGFVVIATFVVVTGLFLWVIPGSWNIPMSGYANLDGLFDLAPWLLLFLVPALSMGTFTEEYQSGTIELLFSRPLHLIQIVLAKYLAVCAIFLFGILFTLIYYYSVSQLAVPKGNLDHGAILGSYIALVFLGAAYASIGVFVSSMVRNTSAGFILTLLLCFFFFAGFDLISEVAFLKGIATFLSGLGMEAYYRTFSKGLFELKDVVYFLSLITVFLSAAYLKIRSLT